MAVYVDDAVTLWRGRRWAHLMADTLTELHACAAALGMPRHAFQDKTSGAHYDAPGCATRERGGAVPIHATRRARLREVMPTRVRRAGATDEAHNPPDRP